MSSWKGVSNPDEITDEEQILNSLVTMGTAVATSATKDLNCLLTVSCLDVTAAQAADHWTQLGDKPKALLGSVPD